MPDPTLTDQLQQLALAAQAHPPQSRERRSHLQQLLHQIMGSRCLNRPQAGNFPPQIYEEIYAEAVQDLCLFVCCKIDQYDPQRGTVLAWLNMLLSQRFFKEAIPKVLNHTQVSNWALPDLDRFIPPAPAPPLLETLTAYVAADPTHALRSVHVRDRPDVTFQYLMQRRLQGASWDAIARDVNLNVSTLSSFFSRSLPRFAKQLQECCLPP